MTRLLVSIRSVQEAERALRGGADLIDVKEPSRGALGRADGDTVRAVLAWVRGRKPVSAAMGELLDANPGHAISGLTYAKWGLAGMGNQPAGLDRIRCLRENVLRNAPSCIPVLVAYADWQRALAPKPMDLCRMACREHCKAFLIDTWRKDGRSLLEWMPVQALRLIRRCCTAANVQLALAGSLTVEDLPLVREIGPDWLAVRGAACRHGMRGGEICETRVRHLFTALRTGERAANHAG